MARQSRPPGIRLGLEIHTVHLIQKVMHLLTLWIIGRPRPLTVLVFAFSKSRRGGNERGRDVRHRRAILVRGIGLFVHAVLQGHERSIKVDACDAIQPGELGQSPATRRHKDTLYALDERSVVIIKGRILNYMLYSS